VILTPGFPASEEDSACLPAQQAFVNSVLKQDPQLQVLILAFQYPFYESEYDFHGATVFSFNGRNKGGWHRLLLWRKIWKRLQWVHQQYRIQGLISFWYGERCFIGNRFEKKYGLPHFCWILGQDARAGNKYVQRTQAPTSRLIAMSDFLANEFKRNYHFRPAHIIPNGVEPLIEDPPGFRDIDVLGVGSFISLKQFDIFINCISAARSNFPQLRAVLCGKGPEKKALLQMITDKNLQQHVRLLDELPHQDVLALMQRSRILLHPSSYEGFSTVCVEALAAGARVISFCRPMEAAISQWHTVSSVMEMNEALRSLLSDPDHYHLPVIPYRMDDSAKRMLALFAEQAVRKQQELV